MPIIHDYFAINFYLTFFNHASYDILAKGANQVYACRNNVKFL